MTPAQAILDKILRRGAEVRHLTALEQQLADEVTSLRRQNLFLISRGSPMRDEINALKAENAALRAALLGEKN